MTGREPTAASDSASPQACAHASTGPAPAQDCAPLSPPAPPSSLTTEVYNLLHDLAVRALRGEKPGHTLQATALVHEVYLRLACLDDASSRGAATVAQDSPAAGAASPRPAPQVNQIQTLPSIAPGDGAKLGVSPEQRAAFVALASRVIRQVLIDHARRRGRAKRGGGSRRIELSDALGAAEGADWTDLLAIDEALSRLRTLHERQAQVVELRFFGGLSVDEAAAALGVSPRTVDLDWKAARAWLRAELGGDGA